MEGSERYGASGTGFCRSPAGVFYLEQVGGDRSVQQGGTVAFKVMLRRGGKDDKTRSLQVLLSAHALGWIHSSQTFTLAPSCRRFGGKHCKFPFLHASCKASRVGQAGMRFGGEHCVFPCCMPTARLPGQHRLALDLSLLAGRQ